MTKRIELRHWSLENMDEQYSIQWNLHVLDGTLEEPGRSLWGLVLKNGKKNLCRARPKAWRKSPRCRDDWGGEGSWDGTRAGWERAGPNWQDRTRNKSDSAKLADLQCSNSRCELYKRETSASTSCILTTCNRNDQMGTKPHGDGGKQRNSQPNTCSFGAVAR